MQEKVQVTYVCKKISHPCYWQIIKSEQVYFGMFIESVASLTIIKKTVTTNKCIFIDQKYPMKVKLIYTGFINDFIATMPFA